MMVKIGSKNLPIVLCLLMSLCNCQKEISGRLPHAVPFLAWGFSIEGFPLSESILETLEKQTQITAQIIQFYLQWPVAPALDVFLTSTLDAIGERGAIPCLTWEPMVVLEGKEQAIPHETLLSGRYDVYLNQVAEEIKKWNKPLIIRFAQEMNLKRYHWGTTEEEFGRQSPLIYVEMFRYIVRFFRERQVYNVFWAFCPNVDSVPNEEWNQAAHYYPGDLYVDILGMDGYNWAISSEKARERNQAWSKPWLSFEQIFGNLYQELKELAPDKPIIVFETATPADRDRGKKKDWLKGALSTAQCWDLKGIIWFQVKKEEDWRIEQGEDGAYISLIRTAISPVQEWLRVN